MKKTLLVMTMAVMAYSQSTTAQTKVKNLYAETQQLKVEQVENMEQTVQLNRHLMAGYNTLCLPMSVSAAQLATAARDVKVERFVGIQQEGNTLNLYFTDCTDEGIEAGVPYLIFSPTTQYLRVRNTESGSVSTDVHTIRLNDANGNQVSFSSSWQSRTKEGLYGIPAQQNVEVLESILISTTADQAFLPTRCGFNWEQQSATAQKLEIKHGTDGLSTGIRATVGGNAETTGPMYDLNGRRVAQPARGLYIKDGKKIVK